MRITSTSNENTTDVKTADENVPTGNTAEVDAPEENTATENVPTEKLAEEIATDTSSTPKSYEDMTIEELQEAILERMRRNGPVTDQMKKDVAENVYHNSLVNRIRSFH